VILLDAGETLAGADHVLLTLFVARQSRIRTHTHVHTLALTLLYLCRLMSVSVLRNVRVSGALECVCVC